MGPRYFRRICFRATGRTERPTERIYILQSIVPRRPRLLSANNIRLCRRLSSIPSHSHPSEVGCVAVLNILHQTTDHS